MSGRKWLASAGLYLVFTMLMQYITVLSTRMPTTIPLLQAEPEKMMSPLAAFANYGGTFTRPTTLIRPDSLTLFRRTVCVLRCDPSQTHSGISALALTIFKYLAASYSATVSCGPSSLSPPTDRFQSRCTTLVASSGLMSLKLFLRTTARKCFIYSCHVLRIRLRRGHDVPQLSVHDCFPPTSDAALGILLHSLPSP